MGHIKVEFFQSNNFPPFSPPHSGEHTEAELITQKQKEFLLAFCFAA